MSCVLFHNCGLQLLSSVFCDGEYVVIGTAAIPDRSFVVIEKNFVIFSSGNGGLVTTGKGTEDNGRKNQCSFAYFFCLIILYFHVNDT